MNRPLALGILMQLHLLLSLCSPALQADLEVRTVVGEDCVLRCLAPQKPGLQYISLSWYKSLSGNRSGILTKRLQDGETLRYVEAERPAELQEGSYDIILKNVTCSDSGVYQCHLIAPVGEHNQEGHVHLTLTDCPIDSSETVGKKADLVFYAAAILILALGTLSLSYITLRNVMRNKGKATANEIYCRNSKLVHEATSTWIKKEDLDLIHTLGPKPQKTPTKSHLLV